MSPRPPTLRENRRYLLVRIEPAGIIIDQKELYYAVFDAVTSLWGDAVAGVITQAVVAAENGHAIIRCLRGTEKELALALSTVTMCRDVPVALRIVAASGTIQSLRERIHADEPALELSSETAEEPVVNYGSIDDGCIFLGKPVIVRYCNGQKVDVIEKGFKNAHRLFLTRSDLEKS